MNKNGITPIQSLDFITYACRFARNISGEMVNIVLIEALALWAVMLSAHMILIMRNVCVQQPATFRI